MTHPLHHYHKRKRKLAPSDKNSRMVLLLDRAIYVVGILGPLLTIPQVVKIWKEQTAQGLSLLTWTSYFVLGLVWLLYGLVHKERPIIIAFIGWFFINILVVLGIVIYS